jgi:two-component SAPR family response regulator
MCKIVVVDDVKAVRDEIRLHLVKMFPEHEIYTLAGTQRALKKVQELESVDIVIFNGLKTKKPNGVEFARSLREKHPGIMLIYTSSGQKPDYKHMQKLAEFGIDNYLIQPINQDALSFVIINSLNRIKSLQSYRAEDHKALERAVDNLIIKYHNTIRDVHRSRKKNFFSRLWKWV